MSHQEIPNECSDPKESIVVELPCEMVMRVRKLAEEKDSSLSNILIEALDSFLCRQA